MEAALSYNTLKTERPDYHLWRKTAIGWCRLQHEACALAGVDSNSLHHPAYRAAIKQLLASPKAGDLKDLNTTTRAHCGWWGNNLANVDSWMATLDDTKRMSLNHPTAIWRNHPDGRKVEKADAKMAGELKRRQGSAAAIEEATGRLHEAIDGIERKVGPGLDEMLDMAEERIAESAENFIEIFGPEDARRFNIALDAALTRRTGPGKRVPVKRGRSKLARDVAEASAEVQGMLREAYEKRGMTPQP
jgi:hypothetical protein